MHILLFVLSVVCVLTQELQVVYSGDEIKAPESNRRKLEKLQEKQDFVGIEKFAKNLVQRGKQDLDGNLPSLYEYLGTAQFSLGKIAMSTDTFSMAVKQNPQDVNSWIHLGDSYLSQFEVAKACKAFEKAISIRSTLRAIGKLYKARNWIANWKQREEMADQVKHMIQSSLAQGLVPNITPADFSELPSDTLLSLSQNSWYSTPSSTALCCKSSSEVLLSSKSKLKIGFISSDFGIHPVATLIRGLLSMMDKDKFMVYCFALTDQPSWWRTNITGQVHKIIPLTNMNYLDSAKLIHQHSINILIDLNGHTLNSGLPILSHRPAPLQISYLGYPLTTGSSFIDYIIADPVTVPPRLRSHFSENLLYIPNNYIVNDHKQMMSHILKYPRPTCKEAKLSPPDFDCSNIVFAVFSNWQKIDPLIFRTWMQILKRVPNSIVWFLKYSAHGEARENLIQEAYTFGIDGENRFRFTKLSPWINHTWIKQAADIVLDTSVKNGHTTIVDALWAGLPVVTLQGDNMSNRVASSLLHSIGRNELIAFSYREYENVAVYLATNRQVLSKSRHALQSYRLQSPLFDTKLYTHEFEKTITSAFSVQMSQWASKLKYTNKKLRKKNWHIYTAISNDVTGDLFEKTKLPQGTVGILPSSSVQQNIQNAEKDKQPILLHIGGQIQKPGWWIINIQALPNTDYVMDMKSLHEFPTSSVTAIYSSHTLEHCGYGQDAPEVQMALREWYRVLKPGGALYISVPDIEILFKLFVDTKSSSQDKFDIMRIVYGGQMDAFDYHKVGLSYEILKTYLLQAGFCDIKRVDKFGLFNDTSLASFKNKIISLNVACKACKAGKQISVQLPNVQ